MRIAICGSPRSGKTVFVNWIVSSLPSEGVVIVYANPDRESLWSNNEGTFQAKIVRNPGTFSPGLMEDVGRAIESHDERIVFVDLGGKLNKKKVRGKPNTDREITEENAVMTQENMQILRQCDAVIILSRTIEGSKTRTGDIWRVCLQGVKGRDGRPIRIIGEIESSMSEEEIEEFCLGPKSEEFRGRLLQLKRGRRPEDRAIKVLKKFAKVLLTMTADEGRKKGEEEKRRKAEEERNGIFEIDGLDFMRFLADRGFVEESRVEEDPTEYNRKVVIPKRFFHLFEKYIETLPLTEHIRIGKYMTGQAIVALCCALKNLEAKTGIKRKIEIYDKKYDLYGPLREIPEEPGITYTSLAKTYLHTYLIESKQAVFLNVDIYGRDISTEDLAQIKMPEVSDDKVLYLSGQIPYYMLASLCLSSGAKRIYTFTPGAGFTCVISPDKKEIGRVVGRMPLKLEEFGPGNDEKADLWIDGINVGRFLLDRARGEIQEKSYMYVAEDQRSEADLERIRNEEAIEELDEKEAELEEHQPEPLIPAFSRVGHGKAHAIMHGLLPDEQRHKHPASSIKRKGNLKLIDARRLAEIKIKRKNQEDDPYD